MLGLSCEVGEVGSSWIVGELLNVIGWAEVCWVVAIFSTFCFAIYIALVPSEYTTGKFEDLNLF